MQFLDIALNSHVVIEIILQKLEGQRDAVSDQIVNISELLVTLTREFPAGFGWKLKEEQLRE